MFNKKNVLVLGGSGFIGTNLLEALKSTGAYLRATYFTHKPAELDNKVDYVQCDLRISEECSRVMKGIEYVFMCAANTSGAAVIQSNPLSHVTPNIIMNSLSLEAAHAAGVKKFLFLSSNTVYPPMDRPAEELDVFTGELYDKYFCVGWMKRFSEILCEMYATKIRSKMDVIIVRPGNAFGEHDHFGLDNSHVIPALIHKVIERHNPIEVWGDGTETKDFIYVKDLVFGILLAMEKSSGFQQFNIAFGESFSINRVLRWILEVEHHNANISYDMEKPQMIPRRFISIDKARNRLGFQPKFSIRDGLRNTIEWARSTYY